LTLEIADIERVLGAAVPSPWVSFSVLAFCGETMKKRLKALEAKSALLENRNLIESPLVAAVATASSR
jgi:hypothetical protein